MFDKTGTITKGEPEVVATKLCSEISTRLFMAIVGTAENASEHPLGQAVVKKAKQVCICFGFLRGRVNLL